MIKVQLIVVQGRPEGKTIPLAGPVFLIGREEGCHLRPSSDEISRRHAEILIGAEVATVRDLGSRNGTFLNGRPVTEPTPLKAGDLVKVGPLTFAVSIQGAGTTAAAPSRPSSGVHSLDEVGHEEVASWLVADDKHPIPDRPSAVYGGETISITAYKEEAARRAAAQPAPVPAPPLGPTQSAEILKATLPKPAAAGKPTPPPPPAPKPTVAAKPAPVPVPPVEAQAAPVTPPMLAPTSSPAPAAEVEPPRPAVTPPSSKAPAKSIWDDLDFIEQLPEGQGDSESGPAADDEAGADDGAGTESGASTGAPGEEWMDESNPFFVAKKKAAPESAAKAEPAKPSFKDSSEAANAILKRMLERKKGGG